jgi:hypothetical protein
MTRQDYQLIAETIREISDKEARKNVAYVHAGIYRITFSSFNEDKFLKDCGIIPKGATKK